MCKFDGQTHTRGGGALYENCTLTIQSVRTPWLSDKIVQLQPLFPGEYSPMLNMTSMLLDVKQEFSFVNKYLHFKMIVLHTMERISFAVIAQLAFVWSKWKVFFWILFFQTLFKLL